jgi:cell division protease FtsH
MTSGGLAPKHRKKDLHLNEFFALLDNGQVLRLRLRGNEEAEAWVKYETIRKDDGAEIRALVLEDKPDELLIQTLEAPSETKAIPKSAILSRQPDEKAAHLTVHFPEEYLKSEKVDEIRRKVGVTGFESSDSPFPLKQLIFSIAPWILFLLLIWFLVLRQMRSPGGASVWTFGKSRARLISHAQNRVTFDDVAGIDEAKEEVREIIEFLKNPEKFRRLGGRIPRGVLLVGAPGTGKTLLAKAIAGEADVPFFSISGSDFVEMFVGIGASRVRDLFRQAKEHSPCIIFLDEVDAVGRRRGAGLGGGHDEREQTLNAILVEMDGFETDSGVILLAATNRPDVLDPALLRPGRFDRQVVVDLPDIKGREAILKVHTRDKKLSPDVDVRRMAKSTPFFSGADLENLVNEAALIAAMKNQNAIYLKDLDEARDKVQFGREKRSRLLHEEEKKVSAYHETGHAVVAMLTPGADPLHKVTVIPRGMALGSTQFIPEHDYHIISRKKILSEIRVCLGGRVAEELFLDDVTSGAQHDFERATELARMMVCKWGMSEHLGPVNYSENEENIFLGRDFTRVKNVSEATAVVIDREIKSVIDRCHADARELLGKYREPVERIVEALLKYETLDADEVRALMDGKTLTREPGQ